MGYQLAFRLEILVGNSSSKWLIPTQHVSLCRLEIGALTAILWNAQWIDDADGRVLGVSRRQLSDEQLIGFRALVVETA